ncbi:MAG: DoxX family protein [Acidimicrobiales bacterium]|nr:DoxX family protein [Acidimicrobiales bacterium]
MMLAHAHVALTQGWYDKISVGLLFMRVVLGLTLAAHGYNKFFGGGRIPGTARWFDSMGMRPGKLHALLAASAEMGSGLLLAAGLLTPLAAAGLVALMTVAAWTVHKENGFFIVKSGFEYNLILAVTAVGIATVGPGRYSLDWLLGIDLSFRPRLAGAIALGVGLLAGIGQLVAFYRPPPKDAS